MDNEARPDPPPGNFRIIGRLDVKVNDLIKGIHLEGWRKVGVPEVRAEQYYQQGIDEILYMDSVASLYGRNNLADVLIRTSSDVFIPITVGGGVRSVADAQDLLLAGADKIAVNTAATKNPELIRELCERFGSQCIVLSIEAKRDKENGWTAMTDLGREHTGMDVVEWARHGCSLGAGEVLVTSIDQEGTGKGFDIPLIRAVSEAVSVPVIASGGMGNSGHLIDVALRGQANAAAIASVLHFDKIPLAELRNEAAEAGLNVRVS